MGRDADGEEEKHHMKLTEKAEGSICCDMKTITLKKAKGKCWLKEAWNTKTWSLILPDVAYSLWTSDNTSRK